MAGFVNIGYGNIINSEKIEAIVSPDSAPSKRMVQRARDEGQVIDATQGRKTKAILVMGSGSLVLSALQPDTIAGRLNQVDEKEKK